jgi:hypothetical protein
VTCIKDVIYDDETKGFYIMANSFRSQMGFYLFSVKISDPKNSEFNIIWHNNIEIDDVGIAFNKDSDGRSKELIVSYK